MKDITKKRSKIERIQDTFLPSMFGEYDRNSDTKPKRAEEYFRRAVCERE